MITFYFITDVQTRVYIIIILSGLFITTTREILNFTSPNTLFCFVCPFRNLGYIEILNLHN